MDDFGSLNIYSPMGLGQIFESLIEFYRLLANISQMLYNCALYFSSTRWFEPMIIATYIKVFITHAPINPPSDLSQIEAQSELVGENKMYFS